MSPDVNVNNKLIALMASDKPRLLNIYCTAGYPNFEDTPVVLKALEESGVDIIELGMPFSDPLADGPTIQKSNMTALNNGMTIDKLFGQLEAVSISVPVLLMGYINPVMQYGVERFCRRCAEVGVSGVILPDLPPALFKAKYAELFDKYGLCNVCLVTPQTSVERIRSIDEVTSGFIYAVSSASTTGTKASLENVDEYLQRLSRMDLKNEILTGFNIKDAETFDQATRHTRGGIIGSAFINAISQTDDLHKATQSFIKSIRP